MILSQPPVQCPQYNRTGGAPIRCVLELDHPEDCNFGGVGPFSNTVDPVTENIDPVKLHKLINQMRRERDWIYTEAEHLADFAGYQTNALRKLRTGVEEICSEMDRRWASAAFVDLHVCIGKLRALLRPEPVTDDSA